MKYNFLPLIYANCMSQNLKMFYIPRKNKTSYNRDSIWGEKIKKILTEIRSAFVHNNNVTLLYFIILLYR